MGYISRGISVFNQYLGGEVKVKECVRFKLEQKLVFIQIMFKIQTLKFKQQKYSQIGERRKT